jgi:methyltransferase (TIGR00027 family)
VNQPTSIHHISDTARWVAVYRARESERRDALFSDPFARKLAGERGEEIARTLPFGEKNSWSFVARTWIFDRFIAERVQEGIDLVVNLAAGLDTRPYRMALPSSLTWVEVDLPDILDYKEQVLGNEKPRCRLERVRMDLANVNARRSLLERLGRPARKAVVLCEGLLIYLSAEQVGALAADLAKVPAFQYWIVDITSPALRDMIKKNTAPQISEGAAQLQFAPANGPEFFLPYGWKPLKTLSALKTAAGLKRLPFLLRLAALLPENPVNPGSRPWGGVCLLGRTSS